MKMDEIAKILLPLSRCGALLQRKLYVVVVVVGTGVWRRCVMPYIDGPSLTFDLKFQRRYPFDWRPINATSGDTGYPGEGGSPHTSRSGNRESTGTSYAPATLA